MSRGPQRVLVTGGAGFVGSHVVDLLVERGSDVVVLDSLVAHGGRRPPWVGREVDLVVGDVRDPDAWRRALPGVDAGSRESFAEPLDSSWPCHSVRLGPAGMIGRRGRCGEVSRRRPVARPDRRAHR